ncbi:MAG: hypothetical protein AUH16_10265 [Acidobacteria bacterium 13_2_20CM_57_7]|nr:MAG: hypothetical protein AUH16_10265 [Acidobacteria bacterium 13_2_20CM_57_7]
MNLLLHRSAVIRMGIACAALAATAEAPSRAAQAIPIRITAERWRSKFISNTLRNMAFCL